MSDSRRYCLAGLRPITNAFLVGYRPPADDCEGGRIGEVVSPAPQGSGIVTKVADYVQVARLTEQAPDVTGCVVVVDAEPLPARALGAAADVATAALSGVDALVFVLGDPVDRF